MMKHSIIIRCLMPLVFCWVYNSHAQQLKLISLGVSANAYRGDLSRSFDQWSNIFHVGYKFNPSKKINGSVDLGFGSITGENFNYQFDNGDLPAPTPNRFFKSSVIKANYELTYNFYRWKGFTFYVSQGLGLLRFNPEDEFSTDFQDQPNTRAPGESFSNITLMLPTQVGFIHLFKNDFGLGFQVGLINSLTDYLDNISDWGTKKGGDNILSAKFSFLVPLRSSVNTSQY